MTKSDPAYRPDTQAPKRPLHSASDRELDPLLLGVAGVVAAGLAVNLIMGNGVDGKATKEKLKTEAKIKEMVEAGHSFTLRGVTVDGKECVVRENPFAYFCVPRGTFTPR